LFSLSKAYGFASWRIGWMVIPEHLFDPIRKIQDTILIFPPVVSQWAAVGAMKAGPDDCRGKLQTTTEVRQIVLNELQAVKDLVTIPQADGAFYFMLRVHTGLDPMDLTKRLIENHKVAVIPGTTFGIESGCYLPTNSLRRPPKIHRRRRHRKTRQGVETNLGYLNRVPFRLRAVCCALTHWFRWHLTPSDGTEIWYFGYLLTLG
jgi:aspartate/methionine/tyrosine aminotransferase